MHLPDAVLVAVAVIAVLVGFVVHSQRTPQPDALPDGGCVNGVECAKLEASGLTFDCRLAGPKSGEGVVLLHGFPDDPAYYAPLMRKLAKNGYRSLACKQRGYSVGASPTGVENYGSSQLVGDVLATAAAAGLARPAP